MTHVVSLRARTIWDLALLVLGLNIWTSFLLLPALHMDRPGPNAASVTLTACAPVALIVGVWLRSRAVLLAAYPLLLLTAVLAAPQLVGPNVYSPWTFVLVAVSFLAYALGTALLLDLLREHATFDEIRELPGASSSKWQRRMRIYRGLAGLAALFPAVLIATLFLHPSVRADLAQNYPGRISETTALYGVLLLALWLGLFQAYFLAPLKAHLKGDPTLRYELQRLRHESSQRRVRSSFYVFVVLSLGLMLVLLLTRI